MCTHTIYLYDSSAKFIQRLFPFTTMQGTETAMFLIALLGLAWICQNGGFYCCHSKIELYSKTPQDEKRKAGVGVQSVSRDF